MYIRDRELVRDFAGLVRSYLVALVSALSSSSVYLFINEESVQVAFLTTAHAQLKGHGHNVFRILA